MEQKKKVAIALRKAKTSLEKILAQVEGAETACFPIIQQNLAVIGLLRSVNLLMLESHMNRTLGRQATGAEAKALKTLQTEILRIVKTSQSK